MLLGSEGENRMMKRLIKIGLWVEIAAIALCLLANLRVIAAASPKIVESNELKEQVDCIIVPGARVYEDGTLCTILKDRMDTAIDLYRAGVSQRLLLSGDHGTVGYDEVTAMKAYALQAGVAERDIFLDHAGFSTYETMYRASTIYGAKSCVVTTQRFHLYRSVYLAGKMDMAAFGVEADRRAYGRMAYNQAREALARVKDVLFAAFRPEPTYLGTPISLTGDGRITAKAPFAMPILAEGR